MYLQQILGLYYIDRSQELWSIKECTRKERDLIIQLVSAHGKHFTPCPIKELLHFLCKHFCNSSAVKPGGEIVLASAQLTNDYQFLHSNLFKVNIASITYFIF